MDALPSASFSDALSAVKCDDVDALKLFIRNCVNIADQCADDAEAAAKRCELLSLRDFSNKRSTLLHWASYLGFEDGVRLLSHYGADLNAEESDGKTPLHWAAFEGHRVICEVLLDKHADYEKVDLMGNTPCHLAVMKQHHHVARVFPNYKRVIAGDAMAAENAADKIGRSPMRTLSPARRTRTSRSSSLDGVTKQLQLAAGSRSSSTSPAPNATPPSPALRPAGPYADSTEGGIPSSLKLFPIAADQHSSSSSAPRLSSRWLPDYSHTNASSSSNAAANPQPAAAVDDEKKQRREQRRARKEEKRKQLIEDLFARFVLETPTPNPKPIVWVPRNREQNSRASSPSVVQRSLFESSPKDNHPPAAVPTNTALSTEQFLHNRLMAEELSLYRRERSHTPTSSTPGRTPRATWKPPSRVHVQTVHGQPMASSSTSDHLLHYVSLSKMDVRSY